ncbi:MAG: IS110 family transposase [Acidimicrobiia bacterium]|nr:IS110 family transposase [Acidimicrobiia bacterium]
MMVKTIGIDPHKATHTAVAIDGSESVLGEITIRADKDQTKKLIEWAGSVNGDGRVWAVESATGLGHLLSQQLVASGEPVLDVPPVLASRVRVLSSGKSDKNDENDARSVAIAALRRDGLATVERENQRQVVRMFAKRHLELTALRTQAVCRLHATLAVLRPGGMGHRLSAKQASRMLQGIRGLDTVGEHRRQMAKAHIADVRRLDRDLEANKTRIRTAVAAADTSVTDIYGVGPVVAAFLVGYGPPITQFDTADRYAAYNGTAPIEVSSGGKGKHRLSRRGNRTLNHAIHMVAVTQISHQTPGRSYYDRKLAEGKTNKEALRALKRHVSNAVYRKLIADAQRHSV